MENGGPFQANTATGQLFKESEEKKNSGYAPCASTHAYFEIYTK
jgi:hypothetical protein